VKIELETPFNYLIGPMFRCVWLRGQADSDLILICEHITADGLAGVYALRSLLELLADPDRPLERLMPLPFADLLPQSVLDRAAQLSATQAPPPAELTAAPPADFVMPPLNIIPIELSESETAALIARCKGEGVSLQAALSAAFLQPFAEQQPDAPIRKVEIPVNLRDRLRQPVGETYWVYIALMVVEVDCTPPADLWELAQRADRAVNQAVEEERYFQSPMLLVITADRFPEENPFSTDYDISISNLGRLDIPTDYGPFKLKSLYAPIMLVIDPEHRILYVSTFAGQLRATYISREPQTPQVVARARALLNSMIR
jgi:hypothetical protein